MTKRSKRIVSLILLFLLATAILVHYFTNRTHFNTDYVNGNTPGNLYNKGLFCEANGKIYFSNPSDNHYLYSMNPDGSEVEFLYDDVASYINADEHYLYYVRNNGNKDTAFSFLHVNINSLCRYDLSTGDVLILDSAPSIYASLVGNKIYYLHYDKANATALYSVDIDGSDKKMVNKIPYYTCSADGQYLYYNGLEQDHNIYQFDSETENQRLLYEGNYWMPQITDPSIYFLDSMNHYALVRLDFATTETTTLTTDRIDTYNVYGDWIYFQRNEKSNGNAALCRIHTDGTGYEVVQEGNYTDIHVTDSYVYFRSFDNETTYYMTPTNGAINITNFES